VSSASYGTGPEKVDLASREPFWDRMVKTRWRRGLECAAPQRCCVKYKGLRRADEEMAASCWVSFLIWKWNRRKCCCSASTRRPLKGVRLLFYRRDILSALATPPTATLDTFSHCFVRLFCFMFRATPSPHSVSITPLARYRLLTIIQSSSLSSNEDSPKHVRIHPSFRTVLS
jgi:hypothetical protein